MKRLTCGTFTWLAVFYASTAGAQTPELPDMDAIARALGVGCNYCHVRAEEANASDAAGKPKKEIAREMIAMTRELNATIQAAAGKSAADATRVECITCHRGVPLPRQLPDIILRTAIEKGGAAAADQYRDLRRQYYGRQSYDFGEDALMRVVQRLVDARPTDAIALLELNLEYHPKSSQTYAALAQAYSRKRDPDAAITHLEKALELDPNNGMARGRLEQLRDDQRRRR